MTDPTLQCDIRWLCPYMDGATPSIYDFSGYRRHGAEDGFAGTDVEYVDSDIGQSVDLVDPKHYNFGNILAYSIEKFSFRMIVTPDAIATVDLVSKGLAVVDGYYWILLNDGSIQFATNTDVLSRATRTAANAYLANNSNDIFVTRDGTQVRIYVNGTEMAYAAFEVHVNPIVNPARDFLLGRYNAGIWNMVGEIHRFQSWNRTLGAAEIYSKYVNKLRS